MEKKVKYIVRQVEPEAAELSYYFDCDCFNKNAGDFCYTLFLLASDYGRVYGLNADTFKEWQNDAENLQDAFGDVAPRSNDWHYYGSYKEAMEALGVAYNPMRCHKLKELFKDFGAGDFDDMAAFLSIMTGREWKTMGIHGYSQGDYVEAVYCEGFYDKKTVEACGEVWLGCANEYGVIELDENGEEADSCYGYIVADCQAWRDEDIKSLVCEWAGIPVEETQLEMIDGQHTYTTYSYRTA